MPNQCAATNLSPIIRLLPEAAPHDRIDPVPAMRRELSLLRIELERLRALENEARKDSWSRMLQPPLGMRTPGQEQAQPLVRAPALPLLLPRPPAAMLPGGPLLQRASFSSEPASSAGPPPAGPREPGWARAAARHLRHQPPDAPIRSAAGSRSA